MLAALKPRIAVILVIVNAALWAGAMLWPEHSEPGMLSLAVGLAPGVEPLILARESGRLSSSEVNFVEMNWASAAMRALRNRVVDAAVLSLDEVIRQWDFGADLKIVLVTDVSEGADAILARPGIKGMDGLRGARVGYEQRSSGAFLLSRALRQRGMSFADVETVPLNAAEMSEAFASGDVDAVAAAEPFRTHVLKAGAVEIFNSRSLGGDLCHVLAVRVEKLTEHRDMLARLVRSHFECLPLLAEGKDHLNPALRREELTAEEFKKVLGSVRFPTLEENRASMAGPSSDLAAKLLRVATAMREEGWIEQDIDPADVLDRLLLDEMR